MIWALAVESMNTQNNMSELRRPRECAMVLDVYTIATTIFIYLGY